MALKSLPALSLRFCVGKRTEPPEETAEPHSSPAHSLLRAPGAAHPQPASHQPHGAGHSSAWPPHHSAAIPDAESPSQPTDHEEHAAIHRGISVYPCRAQRATRFHRILRLPPQPCRIPSWTCSAPMAQVTTSTTAGPPSHPANAPERPPCLQRVVSPPHQMCRALRSRCRSFRGSRHLAQWLRNIFAPPRSCMDSQFNASSTRSVQGGQAPQTLGTRAPPRDFGRAPMENLQVQVPLEVSPIAFPLSHLPQRPPTNPGLDPPQTGL